MGENKEQDLRIRNIIYNHILKHPGLHEREIARQLKIPLSTLDYHLYLLRRKELIVCKSDGHYTQYYAEGKISSKDEKLLGIVRQKVPRKIIIFLLVNISLTHKEICSHLGLAASTTSFHLNKLVSLEVINRTVVGRETIFQIQEPEYISELIIKYKKSFVDDAVNRFSDTWLDLHPKHLRKKKNK